MKHISFSKMLLMAIALVTIIPFIGCHQTAVEIISPRVEMQENPVGLETTTPRFSWQIASSKQDIQQESYQIQVALSEKDLKNEANLIWDSGVVPGNQSVLIPYEGEDLASRGLYYWRVRVTTNQGETRWSEIAHWSMALLDASDWQAKW